MDNNLEETGFEMEHEMEHGTGHRMTDKTAELRFVEPQGANLILRFIKELADYEGMLDQVVATEELLNQWLFKKEKAEVILRMKDGETAGSALSFHNSSIFLGRFGIYLEDPYVRPEYRGQGLGTTFLNRLAAIAVEWGCGHLEWWCLDWNKPSINFYLGMGAQAMSDWTVYWIDGERLKAMAVTVQG